MLAVTAAAGDRDVGSRRWEVRPDTRILDLYVRNNSTIQRPSCYLQYTTKQEHHYRIISMRVSWPTTADCGAVIRSERIVEGCKISVMAARKR